jgi:hypothetical protein
MALDIRLDFIQPSDKDCTGQVTMPIHNQCWSLGGARGAIAPGADFEEAPKSWSPTGQMQAQKLCFVFVLNIYTFK